MNDPDSSMFKPADAPSPAGRSDEARSSPAAHSPSRVAIPHPLTPEDRGRADFYALLARLYASPPDQPLLHAIAQAPALEGAGPITAAWERLTAASGAMDAAAAEQEYTDLFIGVGKSEVNPHGSHWLVGAMMERPLAELRAELAALGLGRRAGVTMLEDHLSALFETMRLLIAGGDGRVPAPVATQRAFFERHIGSWAFACCTAIRETTIANYYGCVAEFTEQFMALDRDALAMDS
jgi:TorA maturation chaperone TorD